MSTYISPDDLRTELDLTATDLTDTSADDLIESAEDIVDQALGHWQTDEDTGRKIDLTDTSIAQWQLDKLSRATTKLAAQLYRQPELLTNAQRYQSISGPDYSISGLSGSRFDRTAVTALNLSGLRQLGGNAGTARGRKKPASTRDPRLTE